MFKSPHSDQNPSEIIDFRGIFLFFVYCGAYGEMDTHTLRETSCIVQHSNRFSIHLYKYNSVEFVVEWEYIILLIWGGVYRQLFPAEKRAAHCEHNKKKV